MKLRPRNSNENYLLNKCEKPLALFEAPYQQFRPLSVVIRWRVADGRGKYSWDSPPTNNAGSNQAGTSNNPGN